MKMRILNKCIPEIICVALVLLMCFGFGPVSVMADTGDKAKVTEQTTDKNPIPDKYNTGCKGELTNASGLGWITVSGNENVSKLQLMEGSSGYVLNFWDCNRDVEGDIYIEDIDFSDRKISVRILREGDKVEEAVDKDITLKFRNCKFGVISRLPYESRLKMEFDHCSICTYTGSNAKFTRCDFGGSYDDGLQPQINVTVTDCYFSDFNKPNTDGTHTDGIHIFGSKSNPVDVKNVTIQNCRFEIPAIKLEGNTGYVNSCVSLSMEYGDADSVLFKDNIMNGGGYTIYAGVKKDYDNGVYGSYKVSNVNLENNHIGDARVQWGVVYPLISEGVTVTDLAGTDALYVGSVWKDETGVHLSVTNDTKEERTLKIVTDKDVYTEVIPACPAGEAIAAADGFESLPFDQLVTVPADSEYVVCLDSTDSKAVRQIRFVNYGTKEVYIDKTLMGETDGDILLTGKCGETITYTLTKDYTLILEGSGDMYAYLPRSKDNPKPTPWMDYLGVIRKVIIADGITSVGDFAFSGCYGMSEVRIPDSLAKIGQYAFEFCASLTGVKLPEGVTLGQGVFDGTQPELMKSGEEEPVHVHALIRREYKAATATEPGHIEYWECTECGKYFSDAEGTHEIGYEDTVINLVSEEPDPDPIKDDLPVESGYNVINVKPEGCSISMNVVMVKSVSYNGTKHVTKYSKQGKGTSSDVYISVKGNFEQIADVTAKDKNNKIVPVKADKKPSVILQLKLKKTLSKEDKKKYKAEIKVINKYLKAHPFTYEIKPADLSRVSKYTLKTDKAKTKLTNLTVIINGVTMKLSKKDFTVKEIKDGKAVVEGRNNYIGTVMVEF